MKSFLVWGQDKSGKTSLIQRWKAFSSQNQQKSQSASISITSIITMNREDIQLVESQSSNGSLKDIQIKNIKGIFIVFDLTNPKSTLELASLTQELQSRVRMMAPIIFLGNKYDLKDQSSPSSIEICKLGDKLNIPYYFVCAINGSQCEQALDRMIELSKSFQPSKDQSPITNGGGQHKGCCQIF